MCGIIKTGSQFIGKQNQKPICKFNLFPWKSEKPMVGNPSRKIRRLSCLGISLILLAGCASIEPSRIAQQWKRPESCQQLFDQVDQKVAEAGVRDASSYPIPGFPYLRGNRFLAALKKYAPDEARKRLWVRWMQELNGEARAKEIQNLSARTVDLLAPAGNSAAASDDLLLRLQVCSEELLQHDRSQEDFYPYLNSLVEIPDEYSTFLRIVGLYPLALIPVAVATQHVREDFSSWYEKGLQDLPIDGSLRIFGPEAMEFPEEEDIHRILEASSQNSFGVPRPNPEQQVKLAHSFAPFFIQDAADSYDCPGRVVWKGGRPDIDPEKPTIYFYFSQAFWKGAPVLQINYVAWYSDRAGPRAPFIEKGHMDGLTLRVSLDSNGKPFMVDGMNNCGCYHFFSPPEERVDHVIPRSSGFDPFLPQWLPLIPAKDRLGILLNSGWHQVERLLAVNGSTPSAAYKLLPYSTLEALPGEEGKNESIFDAQGIVKSSDRVERFILFSMGIPRIGAMRQRGHHAIEFFGRDHFDNPDLFEENFVFK